MEEKYMVNDILENNKSEILKFTKALTQSENVEVSQILSEIRSNMESLNSELFTLATSKGYYSPTIQAKPEEVEQIRKLFI